MYWYGILHQEKEGLNFLWLHAKSRNLTGWFIKHQREITAHTPVWLYEPTCQISAPSWHLLSLGGTHEKGIELGAVEGNSELLPQVDLWWFHVLQCKCHLHRILRSVVGTTWTFWAVRTWQIQNSLHLPTVMSSCKFENKIRYEIWLVTAWRHYAGKTAQCRWRIKHVLFVRLPSTTCWALAAAVLLQNILNALPLMATWGSALESSKVCPNYSWLATERMIKFRGWEGSSDEQKEAVLYPSKSWQIPVLHWCFFPPMHFIGKWEVSEFMWQNASNGLQLWKDSWARNA